MKRTARHHRMNRSAVGACLALLCLAEIATAHAWSLTITSGTRRLFLHVGNGALSGSSGTLNGTAGTSGAINLVQVTVPVAQLGDGTDLPMTSNSTQSVSLYGDGNNTCPTPASQVMVGAGYRRNSGAANATLTVSSPANLTSAAGDTIPFTELTVTRKDGKAWFDVGAFSSEVATMPQPDGSLAFMTIDPQAFGFQLVRADKDGTRKLIVRDGQHEYVFDEVK